MPDKGNQISLLVINNLKLVMFMLKMMENGFKLYDIYSVDCRAVLAYQHQWELEQNMTDNLEVSKVVRNNLA